MFGSMSMDEFLANIWNSEVDSQPPAGEEFPVQNRNTGAKTEPVISQQDSLSVPPPICKKTVDEVWSENRKAGKGHHRPHQQNDEANNNGEISGSESLKRQHTLAEMTLEDFLIKAGVVQPSSSSSLPFQIQTGNMTDNRPFDACYRMGHAMGMGFSAQQNVGGCVLSQSHSLAGKEPATSSAAEIGNLSELVRFDAANCGLTGEIPPEIGKLQKLDTLFLQVNALSGPLTSELGNLKSLKSMDLSNNTLAGEIPENVSWWLIVVG